VTEQSFHQYYMKFRELGGFGLDFVSFLDLYCQLSGITKQYGVRLSNDDYFVPSMTGFWVKVQI
jgi:hypothetical protein